MIGPSNNEVFWLAGFLEGEGSFMKCGGTIVISCSQVEEEPLERIQKTFGGNISFYDYSNRGKNGTAYFKWLLYGLKAETLMRILFPVMSKKRQNQISCVIAWYSKLPGRNHKKSGRKFCRKGGHPWTKENISYDYRGKKFCNICKANWQKNRRESLRLDLINNN